jgi:hypothetical protein
VHQRRPALIDGDLVRAARGRQSPGEHLGHLGECPEPPVSRRERIDTGGGHAGMPERNQVHANDRRRRADARQPANRVQVATQAIAAWPDEHV